MPRPPANKAFARRLGAFLREYRLTRGLSQAAVASKVGCSVSLVNMTENGHTTPSIENLFAMADSLDFSIDSLRLPMDKKTQVAMLTSASWRARAEIAEAKLKRMEMILKEGLK
jgi:transcriptional regulator with XRE-family HTH domain